MQNNLKSLNPFLETLGLVYMAENFETVKADMHRSLEEMNIDGKQFYKQYLSYLDSYVQVFKETYILQEDEAFFFGYNTEFFLTALAMATELFEKNKDIRHLDRQQIFLMLESFLREGQGEEIHLDTMEGLFQLLQTSGYAEDTKWRLLELFQNPAEQFRKLFEVYENNRVSFDNTLQKNKKQLDKLLSEAPVDMSDAMKNIVSEFYPNQKKVYLTAVLPLMEWMTPAMIFQGVLADKLDLYQKNLKDAKEMLPQILKLLGDKSKFEILCLLKSHGRYNLEIAEELRLTPATASHHMSLLLSNHMVTVEKKDGRVYYQLNRKTLEEIVRCFEGIFL